MPKTAHFILAFTISFVYAVYPAHAAYHTTTPRPLRPGAVAVFAPGVYAGSGTTFQLTQDISAPAGAIFLGNNVVLDLNGYTITFADAAYQNIPNHGFENGLAHWDTTRAPGAALQRTGKVNIFIGEKLLQLSAGDEIVSDYIHLPAAGRSYFAMCGVTHREHKVSLFIEDDNGQTVECYSPAGDSTRRCCPVLARSPRLGGGFVTAHLYDRPAGRYRVRVRAETDCLVDHIDLRPAMDVGIGIVEKILPFAHHDDLYAGRHCAFFDLGRYGSLNGLAGKIPRVSGPGTVTIKNGIIKSGARGILSWCLQSTATHVRVVLDNVKMISAGINTNAVDVPRADMTDCRFDIDTPFIINRHVSEHAVVLRGPQSSRVSQCGFFGGQGCLTIMGAASKVFDNLFVNRQTVTNHYSIMAMGDGSKIFHNLFKPEIGSGVEIYRHKGIHIYENEFHIQASPPTCEYGHEEYSTTAIRVADYGAEAGSERGCADNRIFRNKFFITGRDYPRFPDYIPMAWAFFHSVSGGETYIYDNDISVVHRDPDSKAEAAAIYIGGSNKGGIWKNNRITTNVAAAWIGSPYGRAKNAVFSGNSIICRRDKGVGFKPFRMGWCGRAGIVAENIAFVSNEISGCEFEIERSGEAHHYTVSWTLALEVKNNQNQKKADFLVVIRDSGGRIYKEKTGPGGDLLIVLKEYEYRQGRKNFFSPYSVRAGGTGRIVHLNRNRRIVLTVQTE